MPGLDPAVTCVSLPALKNLHPQAGDYLAAVRQAAPGVPNVYSPRFLAPWAAAGPHAEKEAFERYDELYEQLPDAIQGELNKSILPAYRNAQIWGYYDRQDEMKFDEPYRTYGIAVRRAGAVSCMLAGIDTLYGGDIDPNLQNDVSLQLMRDAVQYTLIARQFLRHGNRPSRVITPIWNINTTSPDELIEAIEGHPELKPGWLKASAHAGGGRIRLVQPDGREVSVSDLAA